MIALLATLLAVVTAPYAPVSYACDGATVAYTVNFPYLAQTDLFVTSTTAGGAVTNLVLTTDYSLNVASTTSTATLTLQAGSRCPAGSTLKITRNMSITQPQTFNQQTAFNPQIVGAVADRCVMQEQQIQAQFASTQNVNFGGLNTFTATQTFAPGAGSDAVVAAGSGTGRAVVASSGATSNVAAQFTSGNVVNAPIQLVAMTTDPTTPATGEIWTAGVGANQRAGVRLNGLNKIFSGNPMLSVNTATAGSYPTGVATIVIYDTVEKDSDSAYSTITGRFTVPTGKGGDYSITGVIEWSISPALGSVMAIYKNGSILKEFAPQLAAASISWNVSAIVPLAAGDIVDIRVVQQSGGANSLTANAVRNWLSIKRLSD